MFKHCNSFIKCLANSVKALAIVAVGTLLIGSLGYAIFEDYLWYQNLEWAAQTVTSTGYGNYPAQTMGGSLWSTIMMCWGVIVVLSLIVVTFIEAFRKDEHKNTDAEQDWTADSIIQIASALGITLPEYPDSSKEN